MRHRHIPLRVAKLFVGIEHRHSPPPVGGFFALGAFIGARIVGVVVVGRTTARALNAPDRCEVTRLATDGTPNSCSFLYAKAKRVAQALGYLSVKTYTRTDESGASLRAIGACCEAQLKARGWAEHSKRRARTNKSIPAPRYRWELLPQRAS